MTKSKARNKTKGQQRLAAGRHGEGWTEKYIRKVTGCPTAPLDEEFLERHLWWWRNIEDIKPGPELSEEQAALLNKTLPFLVRTQYHRSYYLYELGARLTGEFVFGVPWIKISEEKRGLLRVRWPDPYGKTVASVAFVGGELNDVGPGWSKPKVLAFNLNLGDEPILKDLKEKFAKWRRELGIVNTVKQREKELSWDVIEYLDRRTLLNVERDSDMESHVSQKWDFYASELITNMDDRTAVAVAAILALEGAVGKVNAMTLELQQALTQQFGEMQQPAPISEAELAREALLALAQAAHILKKLTDVATGKLTLGQEKAEPIPIVSTVLIALQTDAHFEHDDKGVLELVTDKKRLKETLVESVAQKLITYIKTEDVRLFLNDMN